MPSPTVSVGPYAFFTRAQLDAERDRYVAAVQSAGSNLASASVNGQSFTYGPRADWSLDEWNQHILGAYAQIAPGLYADPIPNRSVARFS